MFYLFIYLFIYLFTCLFILFREKNQSDPYWSLAVSQRNNKHLNFQPEVKVNSYLRNSMPDYDEKNAKILLEKQNQQNEKNGKYDKNGRKLSLNTTNLNAFNNNNNSNLNFHLTGKNTRPIFTQTKTQLIANDNLLLSKHSNDIIELCLRCYQKLKLNWKDVIKQFKALHIIGQKGIILDNLFLRLLKDQGVIMSVWEGPKLTHSFRVFGMSGVTDFVEFIRVCQLARYEKREQHFFSFFEICIFNLCSYFLFSVFYFYFFIFCFLFFIFCYLLFINHTSLQLFFYFIVVGNICQMKLNKLKILKIIKKNYEIIK